MRIVGVIAFLAVAFSASCGASAPTGFSNVRVCSASAFDTNGGDCRQDQRATALTADRFYCSATLGHRGGDDFSVQWFYDGEPLASGHELLPHHSSLSAYRWLDNLFAAGVRWHGALPGGSYRCVLKVAGESRTVNFSSGGPSTAGINVCAARDVASNGACSTDESGAPIASRAVTCSALVAGATSPFTFQLIRRGKVVGSKHFGKSKVPILSVYPTFTRLATGQWTCRFVRGGKTLAAQDFTVS